MSRSLCDSTRSSTTMGSAGPTATRRCPRRCSRISMALASWKYWWGPQRTIRCLPRLGGRQRRWGAAELLRICAWWLRMTYAMIDTYCASCPHPLVALLLAHSNLHCALPVADRPPVTLMIISIAGQVHVTDTFTEPIGLD